MAGVGIEFMFEKSFILVEIRDELGFASIVKKNGAGQKEVKNNTIAIIIGCGIRL